MEFFCEKVGICRRGHVTRPISIVLSRADRLRKKDNPLDDEPRQGVLDEYDRHLTRRVSHWAEDCLREIGWGELIQKVRQKFSNFMYFVASPTGCEGVEDETTGDIVFPQVPGPDIFRDGGPGQLAVVLLAAFSRFFPEF